MSMTQELLLFRRKCDELKEENDKLREKNNELDDLRTENFYLKRDKEALLETISEAKYRVLKYLKDSQDNQKSSSILLVPSEFYEIMDIIDSAHLRNLSDPRAQEEIEYQKNIKRHVLDPDPTPSENITLPDYLSDPRAKLEKIGIFRR